MAIDFRLSPEQQALQANAREFARTVLSEVRSVIDPMPKPEDRFFATQPMYAQMAKAGFVHAMFPEEYGGGGMSTLDFALAAEELTAVDINVPTTLLGCGLGMEPILSFGTDDQKRRFVSGLLEDPEHNLASFAATETIGGANFDNPAPGAGVRTLARREGDEWVINGKKHFTNNGSGFDGTGAYLYTVVCRTDPDKPTPDSLAVIVVPGDAPGIELVGYLDTVGHRAVASPIVHFNDVRVPADNILGKPGDGPMICRQTFSWTAAIIGAACVGVMRAAFDLAFEFARTDKRGGDVFVIEHQNAGYMLADLKMRIEAARYLTWKACHQFDLDHSSDELAIMTKIYSSELCVQVVYDAMRLVGVNSYSDLSPLSGLIQDALCFPLYDGGNMGVRRRQLHRTFMTPGYDPMASAEAR
jgi:alkylation response protein AidB-like acyl-CoA dehydrogenase